MEKFNTNTLGYKLTFILLFTITTLSFSQEYEKTYTQTINYTTGGKNGKDLNLNFACKYDAFFGEPTFSSRTKIIDEGDFIVYDGEKYYKNEIGSDIFDNIKIKLVNVSFDIYQGSRKITTVSLENEISVSFIAGSPEWDEMWPGVSEERVKEIWKEGYSIKNARLYDVEFTGFYALENYLRNKDKEIEEERIEEEEEKRLQEEERKLEEEEKRLQEKERRKQEEERRKQEEERRKQEEERRKQEKIKAYNDRVEMQRKENEAIASSAAASSTSLLFMLGAVIYNKMGLPANKLYSGNNFYSNFDIGYGLSLFPISNNSIYTSIDGSTGNIREREDNSPSTTFTIDLRLALKLGYEMKYLGGNIFGRFEPGISPILSSYNTSYSYGGEGFVGLEKIKFYGRYQSGSRIFFQNNWLDPADIGVGGRSNTKYQQIRAGLKISFYKNSRTAKRDHFVFGVIEDYFDENSAYIFSLRNNPNKSLLNVLSTPSNIDLNPFIALGYFFEWKRDHTHRLYIEVFPNYPVTGRFGDTSDEGKIFFQAGFTRSIDAFFGR